MAWAQTHSETRSITLRNAPFPAPMPISPRIALIAHAPATLGHRLVDALAALPGGAVGNVATLEASPSMLLPFFAQSSFFEGHDFAIFDLAAMDQKFLWAGAIDPYSVLRWLETGIAGAHRAGCIPVVLVTPHLGVIPAPGRPLFPPPLHQLYRATAVRSGALCFDLFDCIARRIAAAPAERDTIFAAPDRLTPEFLSEVAQWLLYRVRIVRDLKPVRRPTRAALPQFARVPVRAEDPARMVRCESASLSGDFVRLDERPIDLTVGDSVRLVGALVDLASPGLLRVMGDGTLVKAVGGPPVGARHFAPQLVPFVTEVRDFHGIVQIATAPAGTEATEPSWHAKALQTASILVGELLVERAPMDVCSDQPIFPRALQQTDWSQPL